MLRELSVQNLALIEDVHVELEEGYCAWTGETGAGKSLLLTALGLVLGGKASADLVRVGQDRGAGGGGLRGRRTRACGPRSRRSCGGPLDDDALIVTRRISAQGRGAAHVNGLPVTVATLQKLGERLIDIHGQHEGRALLDPDRQRELLDAYGGLGDRLAAYRSARAGARRAAAQAAGADRLGRGAGGASGRCWSSSATSWPPPTRRPGEYDELTREAHRLANAEQLRDRRRRGLRPALRGRPLGAGAARSGSRGRSSRSPRRSPSSPRPSATSNGWPTRPARSPTPSATSAEGWDDDPARLEEVEARLALYRRLAARFHCTPDELAARRAATEAQLAAIEQDDADLLGLDAPAGRGLGRAEAGRRRRSPAARRKTAKDVRQGDPGAAQAAGPGRGAADGRGRDPRAGRRPDRAAARPSRAPTASRCSSRPTPARSPARCARSPRAASCRG